MFSCQLLILDDGLGKKEELTFSTIIFYLKTYCKDSTDLLQGLRAGLLFHGSAHFCPLYFCGLQLRSFVEILLPNSYNI